MLRLLTFGATAIVDDSGAIANGPATQRRTLALLAFLAAARDGGCTRDKLVALFWPEADTDRARHSLTQALYAARRALRCDDLFIAGPEIRLNPARIESDVAQLERALADGALERAVAVYGGPFLDGFHLGGSPEFEQWHAVQRDRYALLVGDALETLAGRAAASGDVVRAVGWWRRLAAMRPLDSRVALELMRALARAGDPATALHHERAHAALLAEQLGIAPDHAVAAYAAELRRSTPGSATAAASAGSGATAQRFATASWGNARAAPLIAAAGVARDAAAGPPMSAAGARSRYAIRWWTPAVLAAILGVLLAFGPAIARLLTEHGSTPERGDVERMIVAPFRVTGADPSLGYLRDGMVELLSTRLADDSTAPSMDAGGVLGVWRAAGLGQSADVPRDTVLRLAARLGAARVIVGSVVGTPARMIVHASSFAVPSGATLGDASAQGSADSLPALVDRLTAGLLVAEAGEEPALATRTTSSLPALRAYLAGQRAFRRTDYDGAVRGYEDAIRLDSGFALAAVRLAIVADRLGDDARVRFAVARAWAARRSLAERDRAVLSAFAGANYPAPSGRGAQIAAWELLAAREPRSAEAWLSFGTRLFHDAAVAGIAAPGERTRFAFARALELDPHYGPAARLLLQLAARDDDIALLSPAERVTAMTDSLSPFAPLLRWRAALADHDRAAAQRARNAFATTKRANLRAIAMASQYDAIALADAKRALDALDARPLSPDERADVVLGRHSVLSNEGRVDAAAALAERLRTLVPGSHAEARLALLDAIYSSAGEPAALAAAQRLSHPERDAAAVPVMPNVRLADRCVLAQWRLAHHDTVGVHGDIVALRSAPSTWSLPPVAAAPLACAELLEAWQAVETRRGARTALAGIDSLVFTPLVAGDAIAYLPLAIARLHERLGDVTGALAAVRKRTYMSGWPRYLAASLRAEAELAARVGDRAGARAANATLLRLRPSAERAAVRSRDSAGVGR